jgi:glycolate oxidase iron-sulfur subunit
MTRANWLPGLPAPDPEDVVKCVSCGLCLPHCPTFRLTGRETASPRGRIAAMRAVEEGEAAVGPAFTTMMDECLACRACEAACPSGVPFGRMIEAARAQTEPLRPMPARALKRFGLTVVLPRRRLVMTAGWVLAIARALRLDRLAPAAHRASTPPASLRELMRPIPASRGTGPVAMVLTGCVMDAAYRPVQRATMDLIAAAGMRAVRPRPGGCCGALAMHYGQPEAARAMARARIAEWEGAEAVVVNASGCSAHVKSYGELLHDDPEWAQRAARVAARAIDALELRPEPAAGAPAMGPVAVHDACHHLHAQGIEPRPLLRAGGAECIEVRDAGRCCGAAGLYSVLQPELAGRLRRQKAEAIHEAGAPVVAVANPGCAMQIAAGLREIGSPVRVAHPAELVARPSRGGGTP